MSKGTTRRRKKTSPLFGELAEKEKDSWWRNLFFEIADGIFPHRVSYAESTLFFKTKSGKYSKLFLNQELPENKLANQIKSFFAETVGLLPSSSFEGDIPEEDLGILTFKELQKNDLVRRIAIYYYLKRQDLEPEDFDFLQKELWWGFVEKRWVEETFVIEENRIVDFNPDIVNEKTTKKKKKCKTPI